MGKWKMENIFVWTGAVPTGHGPDTTGIDFFGAIFVVCTEWSDVAQFYCENLFELWAAGAVSRATSD